MIDELITLRQRLEYASDNKQYHLLTELDQDIRDCVEKTASLLLEGSSNTLPLKNELKTLMQLYKNIVIRCEDRSTELKKECIALKKTKGGAEQYLTIASQL